MSKRYPLPTDHSMWKNARAYRGVRTPTTAYVPGTWVAWQQDGRTRTGVVTDDHVTAQAACPSYRHAVIPADGGDPLPFNRPHKHDRNPYVVHAGRSLPARPVREQATQQEEMAA